MAQPNPELVAGLREEVMQYKTIDDRARLLNEQIHSLRQEKKVIEDRIAHILEQPGFKEITELAISQDGSRIRIRKPNGWAGAWCLSKGSLQTHLLNYFATQTGPGTAEECYNYVVAQQLRSLKKDTYAFERIVRDGDD
jgi:hypothetical protein